MNYALRQEKKLVHRLQRALPLSAHGKPALMAFLRVRVTIERSSPRLTVTNVFDAGGDRGLMCQFVVHCSEERSRVFVAPITQLAFDRRHLISQEVVAYSKRRTEGAVVTFREDDGPRSCRR